MARVRRRVAYLSPTRNLLAQQAIVAARATVATVQVF